MSPFLDRMQSAHHVLIAEIGGGFNVDAVMPLVMHLRQRGSQVSFVNLSFAQLQDSRAEWLDPVTSAITQAACDLKSFPERWLAEWLACQGPDALV